MFLTETEYFKEFGVKPGFDKAAAVESFTSESGETIKGVLLADSSRPFRRLRVCQTLSTRLQDTLLDQSRQVYPNQGDAFSGWYNADVVRMRPTCLKATSPPTFEEMKTRIKEAVAAEEEAKRLAALKVTAVEVKKEEPEPEEEDEEESSESSEEDGVAVVQLPSTVAKAGTKVKGRGKGDKAGGRETRPGGQAKEPAGKLAKLHHSLKSGDEFKARQARLA